MARTSALTKSLTDRKESRQCVDEPDATSAREQKPSSVTRAGLIRFDFPGVIGERSSEAIGWDEWFTRFKESNLALLVQEEAAASRGRTSSRTARTGRKATKKASMGSNPQARRKPSHSSRRAQPRSRAA